MSGGRHIGLILVAAGGLGLGCAGKPAVVAESQRPSWMPPEMKCPQEAAEQMKKMGLVLGDRIPVVVDETQNRPGSARYKSRFVMSVPKVDEGELKDVSIAGYLYVANHRVFGRYDRAYVRYYEDGKVRDFYEVPFCGVLLDPRWDKDGEGIVSYPGPERGTAVVQDARGIILVVDRFP